jgi:hypothetical protein
VWALGETGERSQLQKLKKKRRNKTMRMETKRKLKKK